MQPTIGRIVHYTLNDTDANLIQQRRTTDGTIANTTSEGQTYPATVVRTFGGEAANLQVHLDGPDTYWATSRTPGEGPGHWAWPARV
ncbi:hypothetical protein ACQPZX_41370 [Actinoplanes sp. CA-142083]|uniref:hypothetical protein n=1 Tax=Actinoplanes sp. CA-142083 TaxID=3239903 RepID=UPI003D8B9534